MLVSPSDLPTIEELETGKSDRSNVQKLLDNPAFQAQYRASRRLAAWAHEMGEMYGGAPR